MYRILIAILITLFLAMFAANVHADSLELIGPGLTWHVVDGNADYLYNHKVSSDGRLIYTPQIGLRYTHNDELFYESLSAFTAQNSIGSPIYGGIGALGISFSKYINTGIILGGYVQNNEDFRALNITPFSLTGGENAFVPLLGFEFNLKFYLTDRTFLGLNNMVTPIITNHNLSFGVYY